MVRILRATSHSSKRRKMRSSVSTIRSRKSTWVQLQSGRIQPIQAARQLVRITGESGSVTRHARLLTRAIRLQARVRHPNSLRPISVRRSLRMQAPRRVENRPSKWLMSSSRVSTRRSPTPMTAISSNSWIGPSNMPPRRDRGRPPALGRRRSPRQRMNPLRALRVGSTISKRR